MPQQLAHSSSSLSLPECWAGSGNEATLVSRDYLSSCTSSTPCFLFFPGLTQPVFFLVCCFDSTAPARCHVRFYVSQLSGSSVVCGVLRGSLREHDCAISTTPEASLRELPYELPLRFTLGTWRCRLHSVFSNFSQRDYRYSTNTKLTVRRTNTYIHTYIHTDTACVQHVNVGLAQARPNYI